MSSFTYLRLLAGFPNRKSAADFCGVTERTIRNWEKNGAPEAVIKLMTLASQELSWINDSWKNFRFYQGRLITDRKFPITPEDLRAFPYLLQAANARRPCNVFPGQTGICPLKTYTNSIVNNVFEGEQPRKDRQI